MYEDSTVRVFCVLDGSLTLSLIRMQYTLVRVHMYSEWRHRAAACAVGGALHAAQRGEEPEASVARHEHRGDRGHPAGRPAHHAALWRAPRQRPLLRFRERQVRRLRYDRQSRDGCG